ncbi:MAG TPA: hypothetical protein VK714_08320 [Myxococcota bacterium]|nr:hypothetical protein [Myxococcota bacterium]
MGQSHFRERSGTHELCKRWVAAGHELIVVTGAPNVPDGVVYDGYRNLPPVRARRNAASSTLLA